MVRKGTGSQGGDAGDLTRAIQALERSLGDLPAKIADAVSKAPGGAGAAGGAGGAPTSGVGGGGGAARRATSLVGTEASSFGGSDMGELAGPLGAVGGVLKSAGDFAASKIPFGTSGTTDEWSQNLQMGLLKGLSDAAAPVPVLGGFIQKQVQGLEQAVYEPQARAQQKLSAIFEADAARGIAIDPRDREQAYRFQIELERRVQAERFENARVASRINADHGSGLAFGFSQLGL